MKNVTKEKIKRIYMNTALSWTALILQMHYAITVLTQTATKKSSIFFMDRSIPRQGKSKVRFFVLI